MSRRRRWVDAAALASTLFALAITHLPAPSGVGSSEADPSRVAVRSVWHTFGEIARSARDLGLHIPDLLASDKTIHLAIYLVPGALWALSLALRRRLDRRGAGWLVAILSLWAGLDELSQGLLGREGQWGDWVANTVGAGVGVGGMAGVVARPRAQRGEAVDRRPDCP